MRSGKLIAVNDYLIEEILNDPAFLVSENGVICKKIGSKIKKLGSPDKEGYIRINYKRKKVFSHRIIYAKFNGNLKEDLVVEHRDGNPGNNAANNLLLVTHKKNIEYKNRRLERIKK